MAAPRVDAAARQIRTRLPGGDRTLLSPRPHPIAWPPHTPAYPCCPHSLPIRTYRRAGADLRSLFVQFWDVTTILRLSVNVASGS